MEALSRQICAAQRQGWTSGAQQLLVPDRLEQALEASMWTFSARRDGAGSNGAAAAAAARGASAAPPDSWAGVLEAALHAHGNAPPDAEADLVDVTRVHAPVGRFEWPVLDMAEYEFGQASVNSSDLENVVILSFASSREVEAALRAVMESNSSNGNNTVGGGGGSSSGERDAGRCHVLAVSEGEAEKFRCALMSVVTRLVGPVKSMHVPDQVVCPRPSSLSLSLSREQALSLTRSRDGSLNHALGLAASVAASVAAGVGVGVGAGGAGSEVGQGGEIGGPGGSGGGGGGGGGGGPSGPGADGGAASIVCDDVDEAGGLRNHILKGSVFIEFGSDDDALRAVRVLDALSLLPVGGPTLRARHFRQYATSADDESVEGIGDFEVVPDLPTTSTSREEGKEAPAKSMAVEWSQWERSYRAFRGEMGEEFVRLEAQREAALKKG